jgi:hypothetical protein
MVNMTIALTKEIHEIIKKHPEIKWSQVARSAIEEKVKRINRGIDPLREASLKNALSDWDEADELFKI